MSKTVVITGASGILGSRVSAHMRGLGWTLRLLDIAAGPGVQVADLRHAEGAWTETFAGADAVIHLAAYREPTIGWAEGQENMDMTANVLRAARERGAPRVVFASSNWVMAGYRFAGVRLTVDLPPHPLNPYGVSKLFGERMGRDAAAQGLSFIAFRIGSSQAIFGGRPGPHQMMGSWGQHMWLSSRDLCQAFERAVLVEGVQFAVLNLMSDNPGMMWDIETTKRVIGYAPQDGWTPVLDDEKIRTSEMARRMRALSIDLENQVMLSRW
jgi:NAD+ dependent glucose-6-phosphate dehydrogenase